ncbi:YbaB/EbfC family nucleoid-associated protein [Streptomyces sp. NPDC026673]|uniref:YbaB/EbfC family nucleoid-associated protein n=1 Tax=Streptomyces sp. NPDC026673 TaxID=3155724 RepID=UPI0033D328D8
MSDIGTSPDGQEHGRQQDGSGAGRGNPLSASYAERIAELTEVLKSTTQAVANAEAQLRSTHHTVLSKDRSVEVTIGGQGELVNVRFPDSRYRAMSAADLAASVLEAAALARTRMAHQVQSLFEPLTTPLDAPELGSVNVDWSRLFGPLVEDGADAEAVQKSRVRDEITDDPEDGNA